MRNICIVAFMFLLSACSKSLTGTYSDADGRISLTFVSDGKVLMKNDELGVATDGEYEVNDSKLKMTMKGHSKPEVFSIRDDGSLETSIGTLTKKQ